MSNLDAVFLHARMLEIHEHLHRGNIEAAHVVVHEALGDQEVKPTELQALQNISGFDQAFQTARRKHHVTAAFLLADLLPNSRDSFRTLFGGDPKLCDTMRNLMLRRK